MHLPGDGSRGGTAVSGDGDASGGPARSRLAALHGALLEMGSVQSRQRVVCNVRRISTPNVDIVRVRPILISSFQSLQEFDQRDRNGDQFDESDHSVRAT